jgi:ComF family protein
MDWKKLSTRKMHLVYKCLFLNRCYLCHASSPHTLCHYCQKGLPNNNRHCCQCKRPTHSPNILCGQCQTSAPAYHTCIAPYRFEGIIKTLIHSIKFNQGNHYIRPLTDLLGEHVIASYNTGNWPDQIIYVPSHASRIKERGFCQTQKMAHLLVKKLQQQANIQCPTLPKNNPLKKSKNTQAQHTLSRKERLRNPQNSYYIDGAIAKHVALFDDIMTTGSTIESCTKQLLDAGAERVDIWLIARTPDKEQQG